MMYQQEKMGKLYIVEGMIGFSHLHEYQLVQENPEMPFSLFSHWKSRELVFGW
ncbi:hypothetical protein ACLMAB_24630 [Brevibacillus laterosporus]